MVNVAICLRRRGCAASLGVAATGHHGVCVGGCCNQLLMIGEKSVSHFRGQIFNQAEKLNGVG